MLRVVPNKKEMGLAFKKVQRGGLHNTALECVRKKNRERIETCIKMQRALAIVGCHACLTEMYLGS